MTRRLAAQLYRWCTCLLFSTVVISIGACSRVNPSPAANLDSEQYAVGEASSPGRSQDMSDIEEEPRLITPPALDNLWFEAFSEEHARTMGTLYCILQDRFGFLWFGSSKGLARYDGYQPKVYDYDPQDPASLSSNDVYALLEDRSGTLWVGTYGGGLEKFDRSRDAFIHYQHDPSNPNSLSDDKIFSLFEDDAGTIWIGTSGGGLDRLHPASGRFDHFRHDPDDERSLSSDVVNRIYQDEGGAIWVGTSSGLNQYDPQAENFTRYVHDPQDANSIGGDQVYAIVQDQQGSLWIGTYDGGLSRFDAQRGQFKQYAYDPQNMFSLSGVSIYTMIADRWGNIWIGTIGGGLTLLDPATERFYRYEHDPSDPQSLSSNFINVLYEDREGAIWIGTTLALDRYDPNKPKFDLRFARNHVFSLYESRTGMLWLGALDGLYSFDRKIDQVTHYRHIPGDTYSLSEWWVTSIAEDQAGWLWIGTAGGGLNRLNPSTSHVVHYRHDPRQPDSLSSDVVNSVYVDQRGTLWVGTVNGLNEFNRRSGTFIRHSLSSAENEPAGADIIKTILADSQGYLWVGTQGGGLKRLSPAKDELVTYRYSSSDPDSLRNNVINAVFEDSRQQLWVGSESGLHLLDREKGIFSHYGIEDGLLDDNIYALLEDGVGYLWLSSDTGLSRFDPETEAFENLDTRDGLQPNQFSGAAWLRADGEMFFGGINGITAFYPDQLRANPYAPPLVLLSIRQGGIPVQVDRSFEELDSITLSGAKNDYEFEVAALSFSQPEKNQYAYLLVGIDNEWHAMGTDRVAHFTDLPGGTYMLRLKAANDDGVWNEAGIAIQFTIVPPFWQAVWFRGLILLVVAGSISGGYLIRIKSVAARNKELEALVGERTRETNRRRQELEALYRADELMHRSLRLEQVLQTLVDVAVDILHADKSAVYTWQEDFNLLVMRVSRGFSKENVERFTCSPQECLLGNVIAVGEPLVIEEMLDAAHQEAQAPACYQAYLDENVQSLMYLPIRIAGEVFAVFAICFTRSHAFGGEEMRLFSALSQRAGLAIENARLYESAQLLAVIEERSRLARDLHDSVKQNTFAALAQLSSASRLLEHDPAAARLPVDSAEDLMHEVLLELNTMIQEMYPVALKERGLTAAMRAYVNEWGDQHATRVDLHIKSLPVIPADKAQALYRITQEALSNVSRHSQASKVSVDLSGSQDKIRLVIEDDGCGFDLQAAPRGVGLRSMRERVENFAGVFQVETAPGHGTRVCVELPG